MTPHLKQHFYWVTVVQQSLPQLFNLRRLWRDLLREWWREGGRETGEGERRSWEKKLSSVNQITPVAVCPGQTRQPNTLHLPAQTKQTHHTKCYFQVGSPTPVVTHEESGSSGWIRATVDGCFSNGDIPEGCLRRPVMCRGSAAREDVSLA